MKLKPAGGRQKKETIKYNHRHRRHGLNYLSSDRWRGLYPSVVAVLGGIGVVLSLLTVATRNFFRSQTVKQGKHDAIMLLAQSKLDSIADIISQAMQDGDISPTEFHKVLQEVEKYRKLKADIRNQAKAKIKQITKEQREELLEQGRKEGKEDFLRKIANTSGTQGVSAI